MTMLQTNCQITKQWLSFSNAQRGTWQARASRFVLAPSWIRQYIDRIWFTWIKYTETRKCHGVGSCRCWDSIHVHEACTRCTHIHIKISTYRVAHRRMAYAFRSHTYRTKYTRYSLYVCVILPYEFRLTTILIGW